MVARREATRRTQEFVGNVTVANTASIKRHSDEIGNLYTSRKFSTPMRQHAHGFVVLSASSLG